ncbi:hypothetical protein EOM57_01130 [Candidatus Saccharibacteria bacterium]|nr:hypothetical protein [Candidatus Saccharibacteria bacterium]
MTEIFIEYDNRVVALPVNPQEIMLLREGNNETTEIVSLGEINMLKAPKLAGLSFECFFPPNADASYVLTKGDFRAPDFYIDFIEAIRKAKKPCRFIVSKTKINLLASIETFSYGIKAGPVGEVYYSLAIKEYVNYGVKEVKITDYGANRPKTKNVNTAVSVTKPTPPAPAKKSVYAGCTVIVNGQLHVNSYGAGPGQWRRGFRGKINFINLSGSHPYHVTTMDGGWQGWVLASAVEVQ